jgi:hypothetical protein
MAGEILDGRSSASRPNRSRRPKTQSRDHGFTNDFRPVELEASSVILET